MFKIADENVTLVLKQIAGYLEGDLSESFGYSIMKLDNAKGRGTMKAYEIFSGLGALVYDIKFHQEFSFTLVEGAIDPLYVPFCLQGFFEHQFEDERKRSKIDFQQNAIIKGSNKKTHRVFIPANINLKISVIYLVKSGLDSVINGSHSLLKAQLSEIIDEIDSEHPYRYLGRVRTKTAAYLKNLIENNKKGVVGRLLTESTILNILASQLDAYDEAQNDISLDSTLTQRELKTIINLAEYVIKNLDKNLSLSDLASHSMLSQKKLQEGFRHLYNCSVSTFVKKARLENARELLVTSDKNISEVVYMNGLKSRSYFSKQFKQRYGKLPSEYQKLYGKNYQRLS